MKKYTKEEIAEVLRLHGMWRRGEAGGSRAYLYGAYLRGANLGGANLGGANLGGADLGGATGLPSAPAIAELDARILAAVESDGCSLDMDSWHTCETTHCRAGWAIRLAGEAGKALEKTYGPSVAGALIYHASTGRVPDFLAPTSEALADIRACAAAGSAASKGEV